MEGTFAQELYSESLQSSKSELGHTLGSDIEQNQAPDDLCQDDGSLWGGSDEDFEKISDLDREWQRRHDQFHTIGYRDGLIAGKEASAQEGFNVGFKQSVSVGYNWGLVRGVSSVLAGLPNDLKEKMMEAEENRNKLQCLYESVHSLSTADALRLFNDDINAQGASERRVDANAGNPETGLSKQSSDFSSLGNYYRELEELLSESPAINVHLKKDHEIFP